MYSVKQLIEEVRKIATARPDVIYTKTGLHCSYLTGKTSDGQSEGCIFGLAMRNMGIDIITLKCGSYSSSVTETDIFNILEGNFDRCEQEDEDWCCAVQTEQDSGKTWGKSVEYADSLLISSI